MYVIFVLVNALFNTKLELIGKIIFYVISIIVIVDYHLAKLDWCGPHSVIFCRPYQEVVAGKFPQES